MSLFKVVTAVSLLVALFGVIDANPRPDIIRERHVIYAPIKFRTIHHHKIQKVPVIIKKHIHYRKFREEVKPVVEEEEDANHVYHPDDFFDFHRQEHHPRRPLPYEDYEDLQQSEEAEDYEYE